MDLNLMKNVKAASEEILKADLRSHCKGGELPALEDWELVMVGGGEYVPCW
jgi:hypothetical protein